MPEFHPPINGVCAGLNPEKSPPLTTDYMKNVWPVDVLERRVRLGQRPGVDKAYSQQIGGATNPIVIIEFVTTVE